MRPIEEFYLKYKITNAQLGKGGFGEVYICLQKDDQKQYAVKMQNVEGKYIKYAESELQINSTLAQSNANNVLYMRDIYGQCDKFYMVMPFCNKGNLLNYVLAKKKLLLTEAIPILKKILNGLGNLHKISIVHRDLKPENVLLNQTGDKLDVFIADYGLACDHEIFNTIVGSAPTMAPELKTGKNLLTSKTDIWSLGVIAYFLIVGCYPYNSSNTIEPNTRAIIPKNYLITPAYLSFIELCLQYDPNKRPTYLDLKNHPLIIDDESTPACQLDIMDLCSKENYLISFNSLSLTDQVRESTPKESELTEEQLFNIKMIKQFIKKEEIIFNW